MEKSGRDLVLTPDLDGTHVWVAALGVGYLRNFGPAGGFLPGVGARGTLDVLPVSVEPFYGTRTAVGGIIYLRAAIAPMKAMNH